MLPSAFLGAGMPGAVGIQHCRVPMAPNETTPVRSEHRLAALRPVTL